MNAEVSRQRSFAGWIDDHASAMETLDFRASVDDLEPLRDIVGGARVVALGESSHHVREFYQVRHRVLRFLVERCGFEVYALEAPFTQGQVLDAWVQGAGGSVEQVAADGIALSLGQCREMHEVLRWMRERNGAGAGPPLRCVGADLPGCAASPLPALEELAGYLRWAAPEALPVLQEAVGVVRRFDAPVVFAALGGYENLDRGQRDVLTGALSRLMADMQRLALVQRAHGYGAEHDTAMWHLRGAWYLDHLHRANAAEGFESASTFRDVYMAESVLRLVEGGARVVLAAHNWHIRRTPAMDERERLLLPAGVHLAAALGDGYRAIGVTSSLGRTTTLGEPTPRRPHGAWYDTPLPPPAEGSIEAAFPTDRLWTLADLRAARPYVRDAAAYQHTRMADYFLDLPVFEAFDAVACVSRTTGTDHVLQRAAD
ncbi:erythromycin esterase family protein [Nonomuraea phyllanthi]|uniref:Erythromycin esterase family protein n=1 Tax=Nonomuraea phyllanthi TaxID=2219224 RepID=A0A5C4VIE6_9ACTN|nr:erythromycin esterase family protein [Nonomuraea phyllanthi]KAB8189010.1 erythromycin esterase family protein [Nonomuraea phyllanthi]QFY09686.1 erythromycin esterase family protein [Nonomuraea phyllanthi]